MQPPRRFARFGQTPSQGPVSPPVPQAPPPASQGGGWGAALLAGVVGLGTVGLAAAASRKRPGARPLGASKGCNCGR